MFKEETKLDRVMDAAYIVTPILFSLVVCGLLMAKAAGWIILN